jgi:hypothetical protein
MSDIQSQNETPEEIAKRIEREINAPMPKVPDIEMPKAPDIQMPKAPDIQMPKAPDIGLPPLGQPGSAQPNIGGVGYPPVMAPQNNSMAIISLIAGILGWVAIPIISSIVAIVLGMKARNEIKASNGTQTGDGMALTGIILGWSSLGVACLASICIGFSVIAAAASGG